MPPKKKKLSKGHGAPPGGPPKVLPKDPPIRPPRPNPPAETDPQVTLRIIDQCVPLFKMLKDQMNGLGKILDNMQQKQHLLKLMVEVMKIEIRAAGGEVDDGEEVEEIERMTMWAVEWWNDNIPKISTLHGVDLLALVNECVEEEVARYNVARAPPGGKDSKVEIVETADALILYTEGREIITIPKGCKPSELGVVTKPGFF